ncbi:MAG: Yae1 family protein [Planctomycetaceae bacterium]|nr:Yae1 family protein [Planctomycetaceae bacterium]
MVMSTLEKSYVKGIKEGIKKGIEEGREEGIKKGIEEGNVNRGILDVLAILNVRFKKVPLSISKSVSSYRDSVALKSLLIQAATCKTLDEFEQDLTHRYTL